MEPPMAVKYPEHDRDRFFKYTSASAAVKILESSAVLYRSPIQFNDPFDVQSGLHFDFDVDSLPDKILDHMEELLSSETKPDIPNAELGEVVLRIWEMKKAYGFVPRERLRSVVRPILAVLSNQVVVFQQHYQQHWRNKFLPRLRVFSVSEVNDNLLMWSHYSKDHTGVVFDFRVLPEQDNPLCVARPVQYCEFPPTFFSEREWLDDIFGLRELRVHDFYLRYAYIKSDIWAYEKEWRVWDLLPQVEHKLFSGYPLRPNEVGAVYLGCRIAPDIKTQIMRLLSAHPNARAFQARRASDEFKLYFDPI
jgi:hypothetical protein